MKNLIIALGLTVFLGVGFYYFNLSKVTHHKDAQPHAHEGEDPHSH